MSRGVIGITVFTNTEEVGVGAFLGETPEGIFQLVSRLPGMLNKMLGPSTAKPRTLFTDRGPGFYYTFPGTITGFYDAACRQHNFKPWAGLSSTKGARAQPGELQDVLLHETAVSWVRSRLAATTPTVAWEETAEAFGVRLQEAADFANANYDGPGLCRELNWRLTQLVKVTHGDRLPK